MNSTASFSAATLNELEEEQGINFEWSAIRVTFLKGYLVNIFSATVIEEQGILLLTHKVFPLNLSRSKLNCEY